MHTFAARPQCSESEFLNSYHGLLSLIEDGTWHTGFPHELQIVLNVKERKNAGSWYKHCFLVSPAYLAIIDDPHALF